MEFSIDQIKFSVISKVHVLLRLYFVCLASQFFCCCVAAISHVGTPKTASVRVRRAIEEVWCALIPNMTLSLFTKS